MELRAGYKKTEVGIIPEDWVVKTLKDLSILITKGTTPQRFSNAGVTFVKIESLAGDNINVEKCLFIDEITHKTELKRSILNDGDLLFAIAGATIGKCIIVPKEIIPANTNQALAIIRLKEEENKMYVFYFLKSTLMQKYIVDNIAGGAQPNLNLAQVGGYFFPLPPTKAEQTAIATALSDADALISSLEKLIAKKRNIKQGAMQKLLQPKEGWEVKPFKDLCWFQEGPGLRNWQFTTSGIKVINVTNLENGILNLDRTDRHISLDEFHKMYDHFEIDENDIVVASSGNSYGKVAVVRKQDLPLLMNTSVIRFKPLKELDYNFLLTFLKSNQFKNQIDLLITGGAQPNFGPAHLNKISINLPPTKEEQIRIATILLDMENEMLALENKLEKYKMIKLGMMQNLLTGKIRLI